MLQRHVATAVTTWTTRSGPPEHHQRRGCGEPDARGKPYRREPPCGKRRAKDQRCRRLQGARRRIQPAESLAIARCAEEGERQCALRDRQDAVARPVQERECVGGGPAKNDQKHRRERMRRRGKARRDERMKPAKKPELQKPRRDLCRTDQRAGSDRYGSACPRGLQETRQVGGHGRGLRPWIWAPADGRWPRVAVRSAARPGGDGSPPSRGRPPSTPRWQA